MKEFSSFILGHQGHVRSRQDVQLHVWVARMGSNRTEEARCPRFALINGSSGLPIRLQSDLFPHSYPKEERLEARVEPKVIIKDLQEWRQWLEEVAGYAG